MAIACRIDKALHMNRHCNIQPAYHRLRALLALLLVLALEGCMTMSFNHTTDLPQAPAARAQEPLPVPVAFIVRFSGQGLTLGTTDQDSALEAEAWRSALLSYAEPDHIFILGDSSHESWNKFQGFLATHPVVEISLMHTSDEWPFWQQFPAVMFNLLIFGADVTYLGVLPLPDADELSARFTLTLPDDDKRKDSPPFQEGQPGDPAGARHYKFSRFQWVAPLFFIPGGDEYSVDLITPYGGVELSHRELTDWRVEEKRRLLAPYMQAIRPRLAEYAQRTRVHTAATVGRSP